MARNRQSNPVNPVTIVEPVKHYENHDDGYSTFDRYRSDEAVPVGPQCGPLQAQASTQTWEEKLEDRNEWESIDNRRHRCFQEHFGEEGGSTFKRDCFDEYY